MRTPAASGPDPLLGAFALIETRSADPLMPFRLFRNRSLLAGVLITFVYMGTFGSLPYFLTTLFQRVHGFSALEAGLGFLLPSVAIAGGTQLGELLATRFGVRKTLTSGFLLGIAGTAVLALAFDTESGYPAAVPGLLISGLGQGIVWTAMWIASATGVPQEEQGVASGLASTTLNLGNAIGLALLIGVANAGDGAAEGGRTAVLLAAAAMVAGLALVSALPANRPKRTK